MSLSPLPVQYTTATVGDIATWVANNRLKRPDLLSDVIQIALETYLWMAARVPFEAFELTTAEQPVTAGTAIYDLQQFSINRIWSIRFTFSAGVQAIRLRRNNVRSYDAISFQIQGRPYEYARWGSSIELYPIPDSSTYTYRIRFYQAPSASLGGDGTYAGTLVVLPPEWIILLKYETLYNTLQHIEEFDKADRLVTPAALPRQASGKRTTIFEMGMIPRLWNDLLQTIKQREEGDEDFSINPIYRSYTGIGGGR